jgi:hypothetical protein
MKKQPGTVPIKKKAGTAPMKQTGTPPVKKQSYAVIPGQLTRLNENRRPGILKGTSTVRAIEPDGSATLFTADYRIDATRETWPEQLRAERLRLWREGKAVPKLPKESLGKRMLFVYGPEVTIAQAIATLESELRNIKAYGNVIGRSPQGQLLLETMKEDKSAAKVA